MGHRVLAYITLALGLSWVVPVAAQSFALSPPGPLHSTETRAPGLCARTSECFALRLGASLLPLRVQELEQTGRVRSTRTAIPPLSAPPSLGAEVALRGRRALHLQLTPTPTQCAPLLSLRY